MCAGNRDQRSSRNRLGQRLGPAYHRDTERAGPLQLRVIARDGQCHDDCARVGCVRRVMAYCDGQTEPLEIPGRIPMRITSGDACAAPNEQLGEGTHAGAGNPHEVDRAIVGRVDERHESAG